MKNTFLEKTIRILKKGSKGSRLNLFMIQNRSEWATMNAKDLEQIIDEIKLHPLALYAFVPFCYAILGIDLFEYYQRMAKTVWKDLDTDRITSSFEKFPKQIHQTELDYFNTLGLDLPIFNEIRSNLIQGGFKGVDKVKVMFDERWIEF